MMIHPREKIVLEAKLELMKFMVGWRQRHSLTTGEELMLIGGEFGSILTGTAKYMIREERHGNTDTPGGLVG